MAKQSGSIDLSGDSAASKVATIYITRVTDDGIRVHAKNNPTTDYAAIDATGMDVVKSGASVAKFGASARIGLANGDRVVVDSTDGITIYKANSKRLQTTSNGLNVYGSDGTAPIASFGADGATIGYEDSFHTLVRSDSFAIRHANDRLFDVETDGYATSVYVGGSTTPAGANYTNNQLLSIRTFLDFGCTVSGTDIYDPSGEKTSYTLQATTDADIYIVLDGDGNVVNSARYEDIEYNASTGKFTAVPYLEPQSEMAASATMDAGNVGASAANGTMGLRVKALELLKHSELGEDDEYALSVEDSMKVRWDGGVSTTGRFFGAQDCKLLWSGGYYMSADHTAPLSEHVRDQPHGIVLVWSGYANNAPQDYDWNFTYIPRGFVVNHNGGGVTCLMARAGLAGIGAKYVHVNENFASASTITGDSRNVGSGTASGINYNNALFVLREVWGV